MSYRQPLVAALLAFGGVVLLHARLSVAQAPAAPAAGSPEELLKQAVERADSAAPAPPEALAPPATLAPGEPQALGGTARSRAATLTVHSVVMRPSYGPLQAGQDQALVVLDTEWVNIIPLTLIYEKQVPTEYRIPNLADHLYLVVNGSRAARLPKEAGDLPGHVAVKDFKLERIGRRARGNCVFAVSAAGIKTLELRFYDYAHGHMSMRLVGTDESFAANAAAKPLSPPLKNEVVELAAFSVEKNAEAGGRKAPAGMTFVSVEVRGRSTFTVDADAQAFDPKARKGSKVKIGHVADWKESRKYLQLVADGEYAYVPEAELTELEEEPRFLPDVMTGGRVVFLAPASAASLELRCDFPNAKASTGGQPFRPKGLAVALEGKRPALAQPKQIASVVDDVYRVGVVGEQVADEFAGAKPSAGNRFLVLDVAVANTSPRDGQFFQTGEQLKYASESGQQTDLSPATFEGVRRPAALVWIPPLERRSFQAVFEIPAGDTKPRLAFRGVSKAEVLKLNPVAPGETTVATVPATVQPQADAKRPTEVATNTKPATPPVKSTPAMRDTTAAPPRPLKADAADAKPTRVTAKQPHQPRGLAGVGLKPEQVNKAIDDGAAFLWKYTREKMKKGDDEFGEKLGYDILVGLALVHAGYHTKDPDFDAALRQCLAKVEPERLGTYGAGILAMLIESYGDGTYLPKLRQTVRCLVENQRGDGSWDYDVFLTKAVLKDPNEDRVLQIRGGVPLEGPGADGEELKRAGKWDAEHSGDNSTSQYALLGLWSASRSKVRPSPEAWKRALDCYSKRQSKEDGGWAYHGSGYSYGSMTCAGICSIAIARHQLGEANPADDEAVERGLAWLANKFSVTKHPDGSDGHLYYYLYSLERVGRILDTEFIGPHEWYPLGAQYLLANQKPDGSWVGTGGDEQQPEIATSFALLFLTRATSSLNVEPKRGGDGKLRTDVAVAPGHRVYIILDCSGSMLADVNGKQKFQTARDAVATLVQELPDNAEVALRAYGHRKNARQEGADEDTELVLPMQKLNRQALLAKLNALRPRGKTPMALSLREAAKDLARYGDEKDNPVTLVLLTDGGEDTRPRQDPLAAAEAVGKLAGLNFQLVGFDINRPDWSEQLAAMADRGHGQYLPASESDTLLSELRSAVFRVPETFTVADARGRPVMRAAFGTSKTLREGKYSFLTTYGGKQYAQDFWINTDATTAIVFDASKIGVDKSGRAVAKEAEPEGQGSAQPPPAARTPTARGTPGTSTTAGKKKFCTECGKPIEPGAKFCPNCGAKVAGG